MQAGTITIKPLQAELTRAELPGKMDPYIVFTLGKQRVKTGVCKSGGQNPFWQDVITLNKNIGDDLLFIELWDGEPTKNSNYLANCQIPLANLAVLGHVSQWIDLFYENINAGRLLLDIAFQPMGSTYSTMGQMTSQQMPYPQNYHDLGQPGSGYQSSFVGQPGYQSSFGQQQMPYQQPITEQSYQPSEYQQAPQFSGQGQYQLGQTGQQRQFGQTLQQPQFGQTLQQPKPGQTLQQPQLGQTLQQPQVGQTYQQQPLQQPLQQTSQPTTEEQYEESSQQQPDYQKRQPISQPASQALFQQSQYGRTLQQPQVGQTYPQQTLQQPLQPTSQPTTQEQYEEPSQQQSDYQKRQPVSQPANQALFQQSQYGQSSSSS